MVNRSKRVLIFSGLYLLTAVAQATAENRPELKFLKPTELPSIGLRLNLMPEAREAPVPPAQVFRYTMEQNGRKWNVDMYAPEQLWRATQHAGRWVDQRSNSLTIAMITTIYPTERFAAQHVPKEEYNKVMAEANTPSADWNDTNLTSWVKAFTGFNTATIQVVPRLPAHVKSVRAFQISINSIAYAFCLARPGANVSTPGTSDWYFAFIELNPRVEADKAQKAVSEQFLPSLAATRIVQTQVAASSSFQSAAFAGKKQKSAEFVASRQQVTDSIRNTKDWWYAETDNYIFLSNMKSKYKVVIKDLQEHIEYLRDAFEQFMPPRREITAVSVVRAFASPDEYISYVGKEHAWSWGLWTPSHKELLIRPIEGGGVKYQREEFFKTVYHEAFHQYIFYAYDQKEPAVWFNEGNAEFFSPAAINDRKFSVGEDAFNARAVDEMIATKTIDINRLIHLEHEQFYAGTREMRHRNYSLAWALVYYLRKGAVLETPAKYGKILDKYCESLWATGDGNKATEAAFEGIDIDALQRDFIMFWTSQKKRGAALRNNIFKAYTPGARK